MMDGDIVKIITTERRLLLFILVTFNKCFGTGSDHEIWVIFKHDVIIFFLFLRSETGKNQTKPKQNKTKQVRGESLQNIQN